MHVIPNFQRFHSNANILWILHHMCSLSSIFNFTNSSKPLSVFWTYNLHIVPHSPNISLHAHTFTGITRNIRYYSHMPQRLVTGSLGTFMYSPLHFLSTPDTLVHISEYFYCAKWCTGTYSGIHPLPSIWPLCSHILEFRFYLRSITKHSHSLSPFSKYIGAFSPLIYSFTSFTFLSFSFYYLHVSCFGSLCFHSCLSYSYFQIFSNICTLMYL